MSDLIFTEQFGEIVGKTIKAVNPSRDGETLDILFTDGTCYALGPVIEETTAPPRKPRRLWPFTRR